LISLNKIFVVLLVISEISWIVGFWPFGYLTAAFIITIIYYTTVLILKEYLFGRLQKKDAAIKFKYINIYGDTKTEIF